MNHTRNAAPDGSVQDLLRSAAQRLPFAARAQTAAAIAPLLRRMRGRLPRDGIAAILDAALVLCRGL